MINGYGRAYIYSSFQVSQVGDPYPMDSAQNFLQEMKEGTFVDGELTGFGRIIRVKQYSEYGYFLKSELYGKGIATNILRKHPTLWIKEGIFNNGL